MNIRSISKVAAITAVCLSPLAVLAQASDGGSAGDDNQPTTYTRLTFHDLDKNHNGYIDKKEQEAGKLDAALFKKMDTNSDGQISQSEFDAYQAMTSGNKLPVNQK
jgi:Ca2+-binding EF-hand superfamily protein